MLFVPFIYFSQQAFSWLYVLVWFFSPPLLSSSEKPCVCVRLYVFVLQGCVYVCACMCTEAVCLHNVLLSAVQLYPWQYLCTHGCRASLAFHWQGTCGTTVDCCFFHPSIHGGSDVPTCLVRSCPSRLCEHLLDVLSLCLCSCFACPGFSLFLCRGVMQQDNDVKEWCFFVFPVFWAPRTRWFRPGCPFQWPKIPYSLLLWACNGMSKWDGLQLCLSWCFLLPLIMCLRLAQFVELGPCFAGQVAQPVAVHPRCVCPQCWHWKNN